MISKNESESAEMEEVIFDDGYKPTARNEIIIKDSDLAGRESAAFKQHESPEEITKIGSDNSKITTMVDRFGNKTETRHFNYHPRVSFILLQTSADGKKQVFVYGQNGEVKSLPENMLNEVLTASPDEIANSAGIIQQQRQTLITVQNNPSSSATPMTPVPSYHFPVQNQKNEANVKEEITSEIQQPETQNKETNSNENDNPIP
jgi:hypothetical protein